MCCDAGAFAMQQLTQPRDAAGFGLIERCLRWWIGRNRTDDQPCCVADGGRPASTEGEPPTRNLAGKWPDPPVWLNAQWRDRPTTDKER